MGEFASEEHCVTVKTTLPTVPLPSNAERVAVSTERLILHPLTPEDLDLVHVLRTQSEVMQHSALGRIDQDLDETRKWLARFLPPHDSITVNCAICLKDTGELIGLGGCHRLQGSLGWPEIGYMLRKVG